MKKKLALFVAAILLIPAFSFSNILTIKAGLFIPRAKSDLWQYEFDNMDFTKAKYQNTNFGFAFEYFFSREISFVLGIDEYNRNKLGVYKNYVKRNGTAVDPEYRGPPYTTNPPSYALEPGEGNSLVHAFNVSITPIQLSVKLTPLGRGRKLIPYVGGGVGVYLWSLTRSGGLIETSGQQEYTDAESRNIVLGFPILDEFSQERNKFSIGYHAFGGFMYAFANRITLDAEFKYNFAEGKLKTGNFQGYAPFDLSGYQISIGINYWF